MELLENLIAKVNKCSKINENINIFFAIHMLQYTCMSRTLFDL